MGTVTQNLLDGQQRLTAFWRAMHNNYEWETFFVYLPQFGRGEEGAGEEVEVRCVPRWINKHKLRMPRWAESRPSASKGALYRLRSCGRNLATDIDNWLSAATKPLEPVETDLDAFKKYKAYRRGKTRLRERSRHFESALLTSTFRTCRFLPIRVRMSRCRCS